MVPKIGHEYTPDLFPISESSPTDWVETHHLGVFT